PVGLSTFITGDVYGWGYLMAGARLTTIPVIAADIYLPKDNVEGLAPGSAKGWQLARPLCAKGARCNKSSSAKRRRAGGGPAEGDAQRRRWRAPTESSEPTLATFPDHEARDHHVAGLLFSGDQRGAIHEHLERFHLGYLAAARHSLRGWAGRPRELRATDGALPGGGRERLLPARDHRPEAQPGRRRDGGHPRAAPGRGGG